MLLNKSTKDAKNEPDVHPIIAYLRSRWIFEKDLKEFLECKEESMQNHRKDGLRYSSLGRDRIYDVDDIEAYLHSRKVECQEGEKHFPLHVTLFGHFHAGSSTDITAPVPIAVVYTLK